MDFNFDDFEEIDVCGEFIPQVGDIVYHPPTKTVELVIAEDTDLIQEEFYPLVNNFGCLLLRKKNHETL